jgi:hypothetical protein
VAPQQTCGPPVTLVPLFATHTCDVRHGEGAKLTTMATSAPDKLSAFVRMVGTRERETTEAQNKYFALVSQKRSLQLSLAALEKHAELVQASVSLCTRRVALHRAVVEVLQGRIGSTDTRCSDEGAIADATSAAVARDALLQLSLHVVHISNCVALAAARVDAIFQGDSVQESAGAVFRVVPTQWTSGSVDAGADDVPLLASGSGAVRHATHTTADGGDSGVAVRKILRPFDWNDSPLFALKSYRAHPHFAHAAFGSALSPAYSVRLDAFMPLCRTELMDGRCTAEGCRYQHASQFVHTDVLAEWLGVADRLDVDVSGDAAPARHELLTWREQLTAQQWETDTSTDVDVGFLLDVVARVRERVAALPPIDARELLCSAERWAADGDNSGDAGQGGESEAVQAAALRSAAQLPWEVWNSGAVSLLLETWRDAAADADAPAWLCPFGGAAWTAPSSLSVRDVLRGELSREELLAAASQQSLGRDVVRGGGGDDGGANAAATLRASKAGSAAVNAVVKEERKVRVAE